MVSVVREYRRRWAGFAPQLRQLYLFSGLQQVGLGAAGLAYAMRLSHLGWTESAIAKMAALGMGAGALAAMPIGIVASRIGHRRMVLAASLGLSLTSVLRAVVAQPWLLAAVATLDSICIVALYTAYGPLLFEVTDAHERSHAYSLDFFLVSLCTPFGALLAGLMLQCTAAPLQAFADNRSHFVMAGAAMLLMLAVFPLLQVGAPDSDANADEENLGETPASAKSTTWITVALQLFAAATFAAATAHLLPVSVIYLGAHLGLTVSGIGRVNGMVAVISSAIVLATPWLIQRVGIKLTLALTQVATTLGLGVMATSLHLLPALSAYLIWASAVQCAGPLRERLLLESWPGRRRSIAAGSLNTAQNVGGTIGSTLAGLLSGRAGFGVSLAVAAGLALISTATLAVRRPKRLRLGF